MENPIIILQQWLLSMDDKQAAIISNAALSYMPGVILHPSYKAGPADLIAFMNRSEFTIASKAFGLCICLETFITFITRDYDHMEQVLANFQQRRIASPEQIDLLEDMEADFLQVLNLRKEIKTGWQQIRADYYSLEYLNRYWFP